MDQGSIQNGSKCLSITEVLTEIYLMIKIKECKGLFIQYILITFNIEKVFVFKINLLTIFA